MQLICSIISQGRIKEEINMSKIRTMKSVLAGARRKCGGRLHDQHRKDISEDPRLRRNEPPRVAEL